MLVCIIWGRSEIALSVDCQIDYTDGKTVVSSAVMVRGFVLGFILVDDIILYLHLQSSAVQSGERTMQYGQTIDEGESIHGQIPRFLGW